MDRYLVRKPEIDVLPGTAKRHFLNANAQRTNKSLGDLVGITGFGFHIIEVPPGCESTEYHRHYHEDECTYVLSGKGQVFIGENSFEISAGDFIGYRAGGEAHTMRNTSEDDLLRCIVVGQRLEHDVGDYPNQNKRIFRSRGLPWQVVSLEDIEYPTAGKK